VTWFRVRHWVADNLWVVPLVCGVVGWALSVALIELDRATPSIEALDFTSSTATQLLAALAGAAVAFTGFAFSVLLLVVQLASSQLSPRATRLAYRSMLSKISLGLWVGTLAYSVSVLESVTGGFAPDLGRRRGDPGVHQRGRLPSADRPDVAHPAAGADVGAVRHAGADDHRPRAQRALRRGSRARDA